MTQSFAPKTARPTPSAVWIGLGAIALGVGFNAPYAALAALYDYPQVLRRPRARRWTCSWREGRL